MTNAEMNLKILQDDLSSVYEQLGFPEDTILADEFIPMLKEKYVSKEKIRQILNTFVLDQSYLKKVLEELLNE